MMMPNEQQKARGREVVERIPRGSLSQNIFRSRVNAARQAGHPFDASCAIAIVGARMEDPGFEPTILPAQS